MFLKDLFENWLNENKGSITKPEKYSKTIQSISKQLRIKNHFSIDLYSITDAADLLKVKEIYFSYDEFYEKNRRGNNMYSRSLDLYIEFLDSDIGIPGKVVAPEIERVITDPILTSTEKETIILSRRGQGQFRENLVKLWGSCSISGYSDFRLLVASHIKPWSKSDNFERIDKYNGLLVLPTYDKLFDLGFIGFEPYGNICISKELKNPETLNIHPNAKIETHKNHFPYLEYHLEHVFKS